MKRVSWLVVSLALASAVAGRAAEGGSILFIGNSFTFGSGSAVHYYRNQTVADLNHEGVGGVPALFKVFTEQAGLTFDVALETRGGVGIDFHLQNKNAEISSRAWDVVVAHGYSTLDQEKPRDPAKLVATSKALADLMRARNPKVELFLTATWSRPDQVYPEKGAWAGKPIEMMGRDIRVAYDQAAAAAGAKVVPVGDAFNRAMKVGFADTNPYDGIDAGKIDLWTFDHYHASTFGYYLEALMVFGRVTGRDPRSLGDRECSGMELGLSAAQVHQLQQIAFDELAATGPIAPNPKTTTARGAASRCPAN
ncbi:MAG TPA: hypothetical protein VFA27_17280 [Vicinamibacterales bacterium]|nr:hypothetical protein [Vicinamibacterales bacterium]